MEISELDPNIKDTHKELFKQQEKAEKFKEYVQGLFIDLYTCLLYTSPSPRD